MSNEKPTFKILRALGPLSIGNKVYYISEQEITQNPSGSASSHIVVKKQPMNEDGSPQGIAKQLFIPVSDSQELLNALLNFVNSK